MCRAPKPHSGSDRVNKPDIDDIFPLVCYGGGNAETVSDSNNNQYSSR